MILDLLISDTWLVKATPFLGKVSLIFAPITKT